MRVIRYLFLYTFTFALFFQALPLWSSSVVQYQNNTVTLHVSETPLVDILAVLESSGVRVKIDPDINPLISVSLENLPLSKVLNRILKNYNYTLIWDSIAGEGGGNQKVSEVRIFKSGQESKIRTLKIHDNLSVAQDEAGNLYVRNTLLLRLNSRIAASELAKLLQDFDITVVDSYNSLGVYRLLVSEGSDLQEIITGLLEIPAIESVEPDYVYGLAAPASYAHFSTEQIAGLENIESGDGTAVAVLDSGLSAGYVDSGFVKGTYDALSQNSMIDDVVGHGTQMSLIASGAVNPIGVVPEDVNNTAVVSIKSFDDNGFTSNYTLMRSIDYAIAAGARVLSMSWGSEHSSTMLKTAVDHAFNNGLILVAAAGNEPTGASVYPAAYDNVIAVGALSPDGTVWSNSNFGDFVSLYAPGVAKLPVGHNGSPGIYAGTSIATAYTAKKIASFLDQFPDADYEAVLRSFTLTGDSTNIK